MEFNGSTAKLNGATIFRARLRRWIDATTGRGGDTCHAQGTAARTPAPWTPSARSRRRWFWAPPRGRFADEFTAREYKLNELSHITAVSGRILPLCFWVRTGWCWRFARTVHSTPAASFLDAVAGGAAHSHRPRVPSAPPILLTSPVSTSCPASTNYAGSSNFYPPNTHAPAAARCTG